MVSIVGKNAVVTGGTGGIGYAICRKLLLNKINVRKDLYIIYVSQKIQ